MLGIMLHGKRRSLLCTRRRSADPPLNIVISSAPKTTGSNSPPSPNNQCVHFHVAVVARMISENVSKGKDNDGQYTHFKRKA